MKSDDQKLDVAARKPKKKSKKVKPPKEVAYMLVYSDKGDLLGMVRY